MTAHRDSRLERFEMLLDAYGADPARWPGADRVWMIALIDSDPAARAAYDAARALDAALDAVPAPQASVALESAVLEAAEPDPKRRKRISLWPFAPLWQPMLALGCALVFGIGVGSTAMDRSGGDFAELTAMAESAGPPADLAEPLE